ncbi:MAG TPA: YIP1 family protein, partial [Thermoanaerobaculia bacterium]
ESIARKPTWIAPLILMTALSLGLTAAILQKIDYDQVIRQAIAKRGQTVPEDQMSSIIERQKKFGGIFGWFFGVAGPTVASLVVAVVIWGAFKAFGWDARFPQAFGVTTHAFLPGILKSALLLFLVSRQESVNPQALGDLLSSNLGFLVDSKSAVLHSLLQSIDVFSLWTLALLVIGFAFSARVSRKAAAGVIVALWVLVVLGKAGFAGLFG